MQGIPPANVCAFITDKAPNKRRIGPEVTIILVNHTRGAMMDTERWSEGCQVRDKVSA